MVLVSHDVSLLQASVNNIAEVAGGTLVTFASCSYSKYLDEKAFRAKSATGMSFFYYMNAVMLFIPCHFLISHNS